jgi:hypothetical protein
MKIYSLVGGWVCWFDSAESDAILRFCKVLSANPYQSAFTGFLWVDLEAIIVLVSA